MTPRELIECVRTMDDAERRELLALLTATASPHPLDAMDDRLPFRVVPDIHVSPTPDTTPRCTLGFMRPPRSAAFNHDEHMRLHAEEAAWMSQC